MFIKSQAKTTLINTDKMYRLSVAPDYQHTGNYLIEVENGLVMPPIEITLGTFTDFDSAQKVFNSISDKMQDGKIIIYEIPTQEYLDKRKK